jgi:hypothetical protein
MAASDESGKAAGIEFYGGYQVYSESGVDLTLLRENLKRSVEQRLENNSRASAFARAMWEAGGRRISLLSPPNWGATVIDAEPILRRLATQQAEYVVVGGLAMVAHGSAYITNDLDLCYHRTPDNLNALAAAFASLHPKLRGGPAGRPFRLDVPTLRAGLDFALDTDRGAVDLLGTISGVGGYDQALACSEEAETFGLKVRILSLDGLIAAKQAAGRLKDRIHLLELEELKKLCDAGQQGA